MVIFTAGDPNFDSTKNDVSTSCRPHMGLFIACRYVIHEIIGGGAGRVCHVPASSKLALTPISASVKKNSNRLTLMIAHIIHIRDNS